jgi:hypothetical protein
MKFKVGNIIKFPYDLTSHHSAPEFLSEVRGIIVEIPADRTEHYIFRLDTELTQQQRRLFSGFIGAPISPGRWLLHQIFLELVERSKEDEELYKTLKNKADRSPVEEFLLDGLE